MSTLEKAITLLQEMPEQTIETVYDFMQSIHPQRNNLFRPSDGSAFGIAHKYANTALIEQEKEAFENAMVRKHAPN